MSHVRLRTKLLLAVAVAAGATAHLAGASAVWTLATAVLAAVILAAAPAFVSGALTGATTPTETDMSGLEFEDHVAHIARSCGLPVIMTPLTGDWGVDIIVGTRPHRLAVQCKRQSRPVGAGAVQEVVAGASMQDCTATMVVTNNEFTAAARKLAEHHGCELVGRDELPRLRSTLKRLTRHPSR